MKKTYIVTGYYGSGKTEFCVNFALELSRRDEKIYIADLDLINPYFRSREKAEYLQQFNIEIVGNALGNHTGQDLPALSYNFLSLIERGESVILDLAGNEYGLNVLAGCYNSIIGNSNEGKQYEFLCVFNRYRPETGTEEKMVRFVHKLNSISKLPITGIVNNSHMLYETEPEHIISSQEIILSACSELGLPLRYTQIKRSVYEQIQQEITSEQVIVFDELKMRESWQ